MTGTQGPDEREPTARRVWTAMRSMVLDQQDRRREVADMLGMSFFRAKALLRLRRGGSLTMSELSAQLGTDKPYTTVLVDGLEKRGLVARSADPEDRRRRVVSLTAEGVKAAERTEEVMNRPPDALCALAEEDLRVLDRVLRVLTASG